MSADPYGVLGLRQADHPGSDVVRKAYHRLARLHHPDKARTPEARETNEARFKEIGNAYEILINPEKRDKFDTHGAEPEFRHPKEAEAEERHARQMYCAAMEIPEMVVRECWCTLEELFAGTVRHVAVALQTMDENGIPSKEAKVFVVNIRAGWSAGREIRFSALGTNNLQSVMVVLRQTPHKIFTRVKNSPDIRVWITLSPSQHALGAVITLPSLDGRQLRLAIRSGSAVVAAGGSKTMRGEGFHVAPPNGMNPPDAGGRGDMIIELRVMSRVETWLKQGNRMRWAKYVGYTVGAFGLVWLGLGALVWALDIDLADHVHIPDRLLVNEYPGSYGLLGTKMFNPRFKIPLGLVRDWAPEGLGMHATKMSFAASSPFRSSR